MGNNPAEIEDSQPAIEKPDLDDLESWLDTYITEPAISYAHIESKEEQLFKTKKQYFMSAVDLRKAGMPDEEIKNLLMKLASPEKESTSVHTGPS